MKPPRLEVVCCDRCGFPGFAHLPPCDCPKSRSAEHLAELVTTRERETAVRFAAARPGCDAYLVHWALSHEECVRVVEHLDGPDGQGKQSSP